MKIILYKRIPCGYCSAALRFLTEVKSQEVEVIDLTMNREGSLALMKKTGRRTVPQIFIGDHYIGGYDDLRALDRKGELDLLLKEMKDLRNEN